MCRVRIPPDWVFEEDAIKSSPSRRAGMSENEEVALKREGLEIIMKLGQGMGWKLSNATGAACVYFHRFYMLQSIQQFPCPVTALGCMFLAGKTEETPKKCMDIAQSAIKIYGKDSGKDYFRVRLPNLMEDVMGMERVLLATIKFDFTISLPYQFIIQYANDFKSSKRGYPVEMVSEIVRCAWPLVNDSFLTNLCLLWEPQVIAVSLFWLAIKLTQHDDINDTKWWEEHVAELSPDKMETICHEVLDYYSLMKTE